MTVFKLIKNLLRVWVKYGNLPIHMTLEIPPGGRQYAAPLGELAVIQPSSSGGGRVELLSEGFT